MKVITLNLNGIRSAATKGFYDWLVAQDADVICLQETRAQQHQLSDAIFWPAGYHAYFHDAEKKGYSGVALYLRTPPDRVQHGLGWQEFDVEGRWIQADIGALSFVSLYMPSGSSGPERQAIKFAMMERLMVHLRALRSDGREYILCGDFNIAHKAIDLKNWRANQKNSGFLPEERQWMDQLLDVEGYLDAFRMVNTLPEQYTWWSNRGQAWAKNVGWRIDYQIVSPGLAARVQRAAIHIDNRFSDHAPLIVEYAGAV